MNTNFASYVGSAPKKPVISSKKLSVKRKIFWRYASESLLGAILIGGGSFMLFTLIRGKIDLYMIIAVGGLVLLSFIIDVLKYGNPLSFTKKKIALTKAKEDRYQEYQDMINRNNYVHTEKENKTTPVIKPAKIVKQDINF